MQRGTTLVELALTLVLIGLVLTIALPTVGGVADRFAVEQAAQNIVSAHRRARMAAILQSRVLELTIGAGELSIRVRGDSARLWRTEGPAAQGVALGGPIRVLAFSPVGITLGLSNASFPLSRGAATRTVVVSRLGRLRVTP
jgi:type II secretory pathway pseudopilin PulG